MRARPRVVVHRLAGLVPYTECLALQHQLMARRKAGSLPDTLLLLEHEPVFTLGRLQESVSNVLATSSQISARGASIVQSDRGGNVTFHGPGQLVAYPILDLNGHQKNLRWYTSALENVMIDTAHAFGVSASSGGAGETGVWAGDRKLGALGVRVSRWITGHGVALNVCVDLRYFDMIVPCGLQHRPTVTSLSAAIAGSGEPVSIPQAQTRFLDAFAERFECDLVDSPLDSIGQLLEGSSNTDS